LAENRRGLARDLGGIETMIIGSVVVIGLALLAAYTFPHGADCGC
jgi:hypothetical protein